MWIKTTVLLYGILTIVVAIDEHRPNKKKDDNRGKRNLQYSISHHYNGPYSYQLERRISTGPQHPIYPITSQYYPGPSKYHKGRPYSSYPPPPYAVQMEPLIHYSQRDPLFDSNNILSLNTDVTQQHHHQQQQQHHADDLFTDPTNHLNDNIYGPPPPQHQQTKIIEKPVYIKEPEPIIEIIIKESNVTLPPPPTPPPLPPKKKEQVQVFYVKYKKNPNGYGKDSVIYDKPIPAISQPVHDEPEETIPDYGPPQELVTSPPPPSTTLRTIIKPDSEVYHSPSGIKVTFGKEGFDYDKRSNKPEDLNAANQERGKIQFPQARQLSSFPNAPSPPNYQRRPINFNYNPLPPPPPSSQPATSNYRQPQPYRPFHQLPEFRQNQFNRPNPQQYSTLPRFAQLPQQRHPPPRPIPPQIPRQPVPYQPFDTLRNPNQPQIQFRPQSQFPFNQQLPLNQHGPTFSQYSSYQPQPPSPSPQPIQSRPQSVEQNLNYQPFNQQSPQKQQQQQHFVQQLPQQTQPNFSQLTQQVPFSHHQVQFNNHRQPQQQQQQQQPPLQPQQQQQQLRNVPPGGELIHSVPKFEQHISILESDKNQQPQTLPLQSQARNHLTQEEYNQKIQQQFHQASALQESIRQNNQPNQYINQQQFYQTTPRLSTTTTTTTQRTTTTTTTTQTPEISTTTKDPKILNAQLPDEVPDDLRQQLLSSGILNNADISILDYDKIGDIPLSALPPEQLANFYSAGGAQQITSGSEPIPMYADKNGAIIKNIESKSGEEIVEDEPIEGAASQIDEIRVKPDSDVEMKVVHYNPETEQGQQIQQSYVKDDAKRVDPVLLNGEQYNRYLPLKVSGQQFPIPDVAELKGKKISSVVVLAPVTYDFSNTRQTRQTKSDDFEFIKNEALIELLKNPTTENYRKFFEKENQTRSDQQAVILLVAGDTNNKEIFMYDVATKTVNRLDGELSSAFVDAAEANAATDDTIDKQTSAASNIVETRVPYPNNKIDRNIELDSDASDIIETNIPIIDPISTTSDLDTQASEHLESFVDVSGMPIVDDNNDDDLTVAASEIHTIKSNSILVVGGEGGGRKTGL